MEAIMQESPFYHDVLQQGEARGINIGEARGINLGARQTSIESTLNVFTHRFPNADVNAPQAPT